MTATIANCNINGQVIAVSVEVLAAINAAIKSAPVVGEKWDGDVRVYTPDSTKHLVLVPVITINNKILKD
jgi:hypothetical protein